MDLRNYYEMWVSFLDRADALVGLPICVFGIILVLAGWRVWSFVAVVTLGIIGAIAGHMMSGQHEPDLQWMLGTAAVFALGGLLTVRHSASVIGGILGGTVGAWMLELLGFHGWLQIVACLIGFAGATAYAFANRKFVVLLVTSMQGGVLLVSGAKVVISDWPFMSSFMVSTTKVTGIMLIFFLVVPTVIGVTMQLADMSRSGVKAGHMG